MVLLVFVCLLDFFLLCFSLGGWGRAEFAAQQVVLLVGSVWARCPQRRGFDPSLGKFSSRGGFSLGVNMGSNSIPPKTLSDESINRGLVCAHMHCIAQTQKILTFMS